MFLCKFKLLSYKMLQNIDFVPLAGTLTHEFSHYLVNFYNKEITH